MPGISIPSENDLIQWVNTALKQCGNVLTLARTELAFSSLITPLLVLDADSPTADERGYAVQLLLRWVVERLAPEPPLYPLATFRPFDDPTWRDPRWWSYNILRHRYLEPLHPDEFVEGGRFTETLIALTGIPSEDTFFEERNRAVRSAAQRLQRQAQDGDADIELRQRALNELYRPLQMHDHARQLLEIAATFEGVFPRSLLLDLAQLESVLDTNNALEYLITHRYLLDADDSLWVSPILCKFVYVRQNPAQIRLRHQRIAGSYVNRGEILQAAIHLQRAQNWHEAAALLLIASQETNDDMQIVEMIEVLDRFKANQLPKKQWREIQILLADLFNKIGKNDRAIEACRQALKVSEDAIQQAIIYRRMGKLYEKRNQRTALSYYQQAIERFHINDPECWDVLKDRAWLHILRQEWNEAENDLSLALDHASDTALAIRSDIFDAYASLYRNQKRYESSLYYAQLALTLREHIGNKLQIAKSFNNLGNLYDALNDTTSAIAAFQEAIHASNALGNQALTAEIFLNLGATYFLGHRLTEAIEHYQRSLAISQQLQLPFLEVKAHYNLVEAYCTLGNLKDGQRHWSSGFQISHQSGFDDQIAYFQGLQTLFPLLIETTEKHLQLANVTTTISAHLPSTTPHQFAILDLLQRHGQITARTLIDTLHISKATATRKLTTLVNEGTLERHGEGRGVYYTLPQPQTHAYALSSPTTLHLQRQLETLLPSLRNEYQIESFTPVHDSTRGDLLVTFTKEPDLPTFFRLERKLSAALGVSINLMLPISE